MGHNLISAANMAMCAKGLQYSVFFLLHIKTQIWLDMILHYDICKINVSLSL